jgi:quinol monooxygenase YgiN
MQAIRKKLVVGIAAGMGLTGAGLPAAAQQAGVTYSAVPGGAYSVIAEVRAKPGKEAALREITLPLISQVRSDPKNLVYFLQEDRAQPGHFVFYEVFASLEDFEAHNAMPYVKAWFAQLPALADGGVEVRRFEILGTR